jgi:hypothetical protein
MRAFVMVSLLLLVFAVPALAADETIANGPEPTFEPQPLPHEIFEWSRAILFDNGPLYNAPDAGGPGIHWSVLQDNTYGESTYGFGTQIVNNNKMADDFTIPPGETWHITLVTFFVYQTGSSLQSSINDIRLVIYGAEPAGINDNIVHGDWDTNVLAATSWSSVYRTLQSAGGGTTRPIMAVTATVDAVLGEGQYWFGASFGGTLASGPWAPPIPTIDTCITGNALQSVGGAAFAYVTDGASLCAKGIPFIIEGDQAVATEHMTWGGIKALFH